MREDFYGPWSVSVVRKVAAFSQRFVIRNSATMDGIYPGVQGTFLPSVSGARWSLTMEWNDELGSGWVSSDIRRTAAYTASDGLVITLGADDNFEFRRDHDYDDLVIVCRSLDPAVHPLPLPTSPLHFQLKHCTPSEPKDPKDQRRPRRPIHHDRKRT